MALRIGFWGTGAWSRVHLHWLKQRPHLAEVVACCGGGSSGRELEFQAEAGPQCEVFASPAEMFPHIDALYVVVPPFADRSVVQQAIEAGIHIFMEKPLALTSEAAGRLITVAAQHPDVVTQLGYMTRFSALAEALRDPQAEHGRPVLFSGRYACNHLHAPWWRQKHMSGGQLLEQVSHLVDAACYLFGPARRVYWEHDNLCHDGTENYTVEDVSALIIRFHNGALASIAATNQGIPGKWLSEFHAHFQHLAATSWDLQNAEIVRFSSPGGSATLETRRIEGGHDPYERENDDFLHAVLERRPARVPLSEGLHVLRVVEAAHRSALEQRAIDVV